MTGVEVHVPRGTGRRLLLRLLMIQASWNHRTVIGNGFAWAIAPALRIAARGDEELERILLGRHSEPFNAHPYLSGLAAGAVARAELDGVDPQRIRRFKEVIRSPLGALGDRVFWSGLLPTSALGAVAAALLGADPVIAALLFVISFNAGHLAVRSWATRIGWTRGLAAADEFRAADLGRWSVRAGMVGSLLGGVVLGLAAVTLPSGELPRVLWASGLLLAVAAGYRWGAVAGRPAALVATAVSAFLLLSG